MAAAAPPPGGGYHFDSTTLLAEGLEAGEVGVWRWDVAGGRLSWSHNLEAIHRLPPGTFDGTFESFARDIHPDDRDRVMQEIREALEKREGYRVLYRLPPSAAGEIRWIEARGRVLLDAEGAPLAMSGTCEDITTHKETEAELALRGRQYEAVVHLGEQALAGADLATVFTEAVGLAAELTTADFAELLELSQERDTLVMRAGFGWGQVVADEAPETSEVEALAGIALRSQAPVVVENIHESPNISLSAKATAHGVTSGAAITIRGESGRPFGVLSVYCARPRRISRTDLRFLQSVAHILGTAVRAAQDQERKELLIGELRHRVGNLFSLVQALHRQTGQSAVDARDLEMKFGARLAALASAHTLILDGGWQRASLRSLLEATLAPYLDRVSFTGSDIQLTADAAFSFSMALHELATNANKYGSLSVLDGRLSIATHSEADALGRKGVLVWKECDGPLPAELNEEGFGSKLIAQVVERQLSGQVTRETEPDGLRFTIQFPLA